MFGTGQVPNSGPIEATTLPVVFGSLCASGVTGALIVELPVGVARIYLRGGVPGGAVVAGGQAYRISDHQRATSMMVDVLGAKRGSYRFDPSAELPPWSSSSELDAFNVLLSLLDRPETTEQVGVMLRQIGDGAVRLDDGGAGGVRATIAEDARGLLESLREPSDAVGLLAGSGLGVQRAGAVLAAAWCLGMVVLEGSSKGSGVSRGSDVDPSLRDRRNRLLKRAFKNIPGAELLGAGGRRDAQQAGSDAGPSVPVSSQAAAPPVAGGKQEASPKREQGASPSPEAMALTREIGALEKEIFTQDFYRRLSLNRPATDSDVKSAFFIKAKRFHPDRAAGLHLSEEDTKRLTKVFEAMQQAYETLRDKNRRSSYDASIGDPQTNQERDRNRALASAEIDFKKGEALSKKKDYARAVEYLGSAVGVDPKNGKWLVVYAWAKFNVGPREKVKEEVRRLLQRAGGLEGAKGQAHYYLGLIYRIDDDLERAERHFALAVENEPKLLEAQSELRDVRRRLGKGGASHGAKGLLGRMLGKK